MSHIAQSLNSVRERIRLAAVQAGRAPEAITLLAVSKTKPPQMIREAIAAGQMAFGESYLSEALDKMAALHEPAIEWHFIGRIQGNKTRDIAQHFAWVHSLASEKHAQRLSDQRPEQLPALQCCLQLNLSGEASKGGVTPEQLFPLAERVAGLPRLQLRGLMTLPNPASNTQAQQQVFEQLARLREQLNARGLRLDTLSMGMSGDLELAVAAGSTLVRVGSDIFGPRT